MKEGTWWFSLSLLTRTSKTSVDSSHLQSFYPTGCFIDESLNLLCLLFHIYDTLTHPGEFFSVEASRLFQ